MRERIYELAGEDMEAEGGTFQFVRFVQFLSVFHEKTPRIQKLNCISFPNNTQTLKFFST